MKRNSEVAPLSTMEGGRADWAGEIRNEEKEGKNARGDARVDAEGRDEGRRRGCRR